MKKNIVIIHYNTPHLTECLVRSINLFMKDAVIYVFDNSDKFPFTAKFDNVTVIDNTRGQIIDFDKWLENYPRKIASPGKVNNWGSAKHCYSVEKCMDLIEENFFLFDSDILLKKDISELADDECIYVGETVTQPSSNIKRILPFMCYINVDMCKKNGVHYFNHNYMHGLAYNVNNKRADYYDTGAGFYIGASKFKHKDIELSDYIVHYGHGSWNSRRCKQQCTQEKWAMLNKRFWTTDRNKKVVYTCITGSYDGLIDPEYISEGYDYICFTDNKEFKSDIWDIRPLPKEVEGLSQIKKQRYIKINPHLFLQEYDLSVWVDGNVTIKSDLNTLVNKTISDDYSVYVPKHPFRTCIYSEARAVVSMKKDTKEIVDPQITRYQGEGFPKDYGLLQSNILIRKHNNEDCKKLMEAWSNEVMNGSHRDQLSFNYISWKNKDIKVFYLDSKIYDSEWFKWGKIHKKATNTIKVKVNGTKIISKSELRSRINKNREAFNQLIAKKRLTTNNIVIY